VSGSPGEGGEREGRDGSDAETEPTARADGPETPTPGGERRGGSGRGGPDPPAPEGHQGGEDWVLFARDVVSSVAAVVLVGCFLFAVSGVWPPLVAVESPSMVPNMQPNDLVFVMDEQRFPGEGHRAGVVSAHAGAETGYEKFGHSGDVVVFERNGRAGPTPIIHRAMFYVEEGENWYDRADPDHVAGADACEVDDNPETDTGLRNCPAPNAGFITKGDGNSNYDQVTGLSRPVDPDWVVGTAEVRVPGLGWIRLQSAGA